MGRGECLDSHTEGPRDPRAASAENRWLKWWVPIACMWGQLGNTGRHLGRAQATIPLSGGADRSHWDLL